MKKFTAPFIIVICCFLFNIFLCPQGVWAAQGQDLDITPIPLKELTEDAEKVLDPTNQDILDKMHKSSITTLVGKLGIDMVMSLFDIAFNETEDKLDEILNHLELLEKQLDVQFNEMSEEIAAAQLSQYMIELDKIKAMVLTDVQSLREIADVNLTEEQRTIKIQELRTSIYEHKYDEALNLIDILISGDGVSQSLLEVQENYLKAKYAFQGEGYYDDRAALYNYLVNLRMEIVLLQMNYDMSLDGPFNPLGNYYRSALTRYNGLYDFINDLTETMDLGELYDVSHMTVETEGGRCRVMVSNRNEDLVYLIPTTFSYSQDFFSDKSYKQQSGNITTSYYIYKKDNSLDAAMASQEVCGVKFNLIGKEKAEALANGSQGNIDQWLEKEMGFDITLTKESTVAQLKKSYDTRYDNSHSNEHWEKDYCSDGGAVFTGELLTYQTINAENVCLENSPKYLAFIYYASASEFANREEETEEPVNNVTAASSQLVRPLSWADNDINAAIASLNAYGTLDISLLGSNLKGGGTGNVLDFTTNSNVSPGVTVEGAQYDKSAIQLKFANTNTSSQTSEYTLENGLFTIINPEAAYEYVPIVDLSQCGVGTTLRLKGDVKFEYDGEPLTDWVYGVAIAPPTVGGTIYGDLMSSLQGLAGDTYNKTSIKNFKYGIKGNGGVVTLKDAYIRIEDCAYGIDSAVTFNGGNYVFENNQIDFTEKFSAKDLNNVPMIITDSDDYKYSDYGKVKLNLTSLYGDTVSGEILYLSNYKTGIRTPFMVWDFIAKDSLASYDSTFATLLPPGTYSVENESGSLHTPYFTVNAQNYLTGSYQLTDEERVEPTDEIDNWLELAMVDLQDGDTLDLSLVKDDSHYTYTIPNGVTALTVVGAAGDNPLNLTLTTADDRTAPLTLTIENLFIQTDTGSAVDIAKNGEDNKLLFKGSNSLITKDATAAAVRVPDLTYTVEEPTAPYLGQLTMGSANNSDKDTLVAKGASGNGKGAGIGGSRYELAGRINITGGDLYFTSHNGAGVGGGSYYGSGGEITISGGNIKAESTGNSTAIGGGSNSDSGRIAITGGNITLIDQRGTVAGIGYAPGYPKSILPTINRPSTGTVDIKFANVRSFNNETSLAPVIYTKNFDSSYTSIKAVIMESATKRLNNYKVNIIDNSGEIKSTVTTWGSDTINDKLSGGSIYTYLPPGSYSFQSAENTSLIGTNRVYPTGVIKSNGANLGEVDLILTEVNYSPLAFGDVKSNAWYNLAIAYVYRHSLMIGVSKDSFAPNEGMTRAMVTAILARLSKEDISAYKDSVFSDVSNKAWYSHSVAWAYQNDIVEGVGSGKFEPNYPVTREQVVKMFYRYAKYVGLDTKDRSTLESFTDAGQVSFWAEKPMQWAVKTGLIKGYEDKTLRPQNIVTRAEAATMLHNFIENVMS